jgi:hypothetical protein
MKNLFYLLLIILCGVSCFSAITATSTEAFVIASLMMCLSAGVYTISLKLSKDYD